MIEIEEVGTGEPRASIVFSPDHDCANVRPVVISPDRTTVAVGDWNRFDLLGPSRLEQVIRVWDAANSAEVAKLPLSFGRGLFLGYRSTASRSWQLCGQARAW